MTCIVGVVGEGGHVLIGGDSAGSNGSDLVVRRDPKVFRLDVSILSGTEHATKRTPAKLVVGYTTSFRMGQIIQYFMEPPALHEEEDPHAYLVKKFVPCLRDVLRVNGWLKAEHGREEGGTFLIGTPPMNGKRGRVFEIQGDHQVAEAYDGHDSCGSGYAHAQGALSACGPGGDARLKIEIALHAAERWNAGVRGPFIVESTDPAKDTDLFR